MNKLLAASLAFAALVTTAPVSAADLPAKMYSKAPVTAAPGTNWTGCYVGANIGYGFARHSEVSPGPPEIDRGSNTASGIVGGGQLGCDYQMGAWVFGIQGLFDGADLKGTHIDPANALIVWSTSVPWFATVTGRLGYTLQPATLLYGKGGVAWAKDRNSQAGTGVLAGVTQTAPDATVTGWTLGAGVEHMFAPNWSVFAEYDYLDFGTRSATFTRNTDGATFPSDVKLNAHAFLLGVNFRFR